MVISRGLPELLFDEKFENLPQWVLLTDLKELMWCKEGFEAILSMLGDPLESEYITTPWIHGLHACVMTDFIKELPSRIPTTTSRGGKSLTSFIKVRYQFVQLMWTLCWCFRHMDGDCRRVEKTRDEVEELPLVNTRRGSASARKRKKKVKKKLPRCLSGEQNLPPMRFPEAIPSATYSLSITSHASSITPITSTIREPCKSHAK